MTPWAARALDRALAATVVSAIRHLDPEMTPEQAVATLKDHPGVRTQVRDAIVSRAPSDAIAGGATALAAQIDSLIDAWLETADVQTAGGDAFSYSAAKSRIGCFTNRWRLASTISSPHSDISLGRSMRDVEAGVCSRSAIPTDHPSRTRTTSNDEKHTKTEPARLDFRPGRDG